MPVGTQVDNAHVGEPAPGGEELLDLYHELDAVHCVAYPPIVVGVVHLYGHDPGRPVHSDDSIADGSRQGLPRCADNAGNLGAMRAKVVIVGIARFGVISTCETKDFASLDDIKTGVRQESEADGASGL